MTIDRQLDEEVDELIFAALNSFHQAEKTLVKHYESARSKNDQENLEYALQKIAFLHSLRKDCPTANRAYLQWENESRDPSLAKVEHAFFLLSTSNDYKGALKKSEEVEDAIEPRIRANVASEPELRSFFRALHVKGRSLLKLGGTDEVKNTLRRINRFIQEKKQLQVGYELDFVEECLNVEVAIEECEAYLHNAHWSSYDSPVFEPRKSEALKRIASLRK